MFREKNQEVLQVVPKVVGKLKHVFQEAELKLSLTGGGNEGKRMLNTSNK